LYIKHYTILIVSQLQFAPVHCSGLDESLHTQPNWWNGINPVYTGKVRTHSL